MPARWKSGGTRGTQRPGGPFEAVCYVRGCLLVPLLSLLITLLLSSSLLCSALLLKTPPADSLATVTYLADGGGPTVVLDSTRTGGDGAATAPAQAYISFPAAGKHLVFSGRLLHGVPAGAAWAVRDRAANLVLVWLDHRTRRADRWHRTLLAS